MSFSIIGELPNVSELKDKYKITDKAQIIKKEKELELENIIKGRSDKLVLIVGPCSADNETAILDYAHKMSMIQEEIKDKILLIIRVYTSKPRTSLKDYKGLIHSPDVLKEENIILGIELMRKIHIKIINETGLLIADELLYTDVYPYIEDTVSYCAIGARSVEDQHHRLFSSGISQAVGFKNPINGNIDTAIECISSAKLKAHCIMNGYEVETSGNDLTHLILRGYQDCAGINYENYTYNNIQNIIKNFHDKNIKYPTIIIDCNHSNSGKKYILQKEIINEVLSYMDIRKYIKGFMIESYLLSGKQAISSNLIYGQSITDGCIGFEETRDIIYNIAKKI